MDDQLFEYLLSKPETKTIDFKKNTYDFSKDKNAEDSNLVKDILSFANTIRSETAYIIAGVTIDKGNKVLHGIAGMLDDASLQQKVQSKIQLTLHFLSYDFPYRGKVFGIIEIPIHPYARPLWPSVDMKGCKSAKVYHRVGSSNTEANAHEILAINEWLKGLREPSLPKLDRPVIEELDNYIDRTVTPADGDPIAQMLLDHESLEKVLTKHNKVALLGWGLSGKSTELKRIAYRLSQQENNYVYLIPLSNHIDEPIASHIPHIERINPNSLIVLLDGLDEVLPSEFEMARRHISQFVHDHPNATVVVSCRTNFYVTDTEENGLGTLNDFKSYRLDNLNQKEIDQYIDKTYPKDKAAFLQEIRKKNLLELLTIPYYLIKLSRQYHNHHQIAGSKAELFQAEIRELIAKDIAKVKHTGREIIENQLFEMLKKLAFIMEAKGANTISTIELSEIFQNQDDLQLIMSAGSVFFGTDDTKKIWRFNHNNTQEYLAAQVLADLPFKKIRRIIGNSPNYKRIKPSWVNTVSFLNSILSPRSSLKNRITKWMVKYNRELAIMLEPENITDELRYQVFTRIFNDFKKKKRYINRNIYKIEDLAEFSESTIVFEFLLNELNEPNNIPSVANALNIINHYNLSKYPGYQDAFKPLYGRFLLGEKSEYHYLALIGYLTLFNLSKDEFKQVFEKFRDNDDTWIRYQLFMGIWLTNNQDGLVSYLLEQTKFLQNEDRVTKRRSSKEMRLSNEQQEIANGLMRLNSIEGVRLLFTETTGDFIAFYNSLNFHKVFECALTTSLKYTTDKTLTAAIDNIFSVHHTYILHDNRKNAIFPKYYSASGRTSEILQNLYSTKGLTDFSVGYAIGKMADSAFIDYLVEESQEGRISSDSIDMLARFMERDENASEAYFRKVFNLGDKAQVVTRDFNMEQQATQRRNLAALFNKVIYAAEIKKIFDAFGKTTLTYKDRYSYREPDFWSDDFCEVARDVLELHPHGPDALLPNILENIDKNFEGNLIYRVYEYLLDHNEAELTEDQEKRITEWCNAQVGIVRFKQAITQHTPSEWSWDTNALMLSFFIRRLQLTDYEDTVYLDMLSFSKFRDTLIEITAFVHDTVGFDKTKARVMENLKAGIQNNQVIKSHVDYLVEHEIKEGVDLLISYLAATSGSDPYHLLKAYVDLNGDIEKLQSVLDQSDSYFRNSLIEQFLRAESPTIGVYLKKKFNTAHDDKEKLNFSRYLIRLQDEQGLRFYIDYLKKGNFVPDDSSPINPLYSLRKTKFVWPVLDLYELAQQPQFYADSFYDLRNISATALQNIALHNNNFPKFRKKVRFWIFRRKLINKLRAMPPNLIKDINYFVENFAKQFYVTRVVMLSQEDAIALYRKIINRR